MPLDVQIEIFKVLFLRVFQWDDYLPLCALKQEMSFKKQSIAQKVELIGRGIKSYGNA